MESLGAQKLSIAIFCIRCRNRGWIWMTRLKPNRLINPDGKGNIPLSPAEISENGTVVHLKGYGFVKIFGIVTKNGNTEYQAANDLTIAWELAKHGRNRIKRVNRAVLEQIDNIEDVRAETSAWQEFRNNKNAKVNRQFTAKNARIKLKRLYPTLES